MRAKVNSKKVVTSKVKTPVADHEEEEKDIVPTKKVIKPIEIDEEVPVVDTEEKVPDDAVVDSEAEETDDAGLNEEDLDPFGDKWEV